MKRRMSLRIAWVFIIIAILFSYFPMEMMGSCSEEEDHSTGKRVDCGYAFHCPMIFTPALPLLPTLSINGRLKWMSPTEKVEELPRLIFHPPETSFNI